VARPRIVIVGAGRAGHRTARTLSRQARGGAGITVPGPSDYSLYLPLPALVAAGVPEPRRVTVLPMAHGRVRRGVQPGPVRSGSVPPDTSSPEQARMPGTPSPRAPADR
jgi:hypothetical protein